ncbi:CHASE2 domain-containing protein [Flagellimonas onchidii]|uniref:CHASE2 domain-containing protein n=1 Tax=Flagellimonas onchidii TaxID=2562684 RepID=UPI0010A66A61|nr:CHASE2 domain-containing protein [Allomuricauda onchidii]
MKIQNSFLLWRDALGCTLLTFLIGGFFYLLLNSANFLSPIENAFRDFNYSDIYYSKLQDSVTKTDKIILVNVGHANRLEIAMGLQTVTSQNPKVIGLDMIFKDAKEPNSDSILKAILKSTPNLVSAFRFDRDRIVDNHPKFEIPLKNSGYLDLSINDETSVVRQFTGAKTIKNNTLLAFPVKVALEAGFLDKDKIAKLYDHELTINYFGNQNRYLSFDIEELLDRKNIPAMYNAIVLFGFMGDSLGDNFSLEDRHYSPLNPKFAGRSFPDIYGLVIHANIIEMFTTSQFIYRVPNFFSWLFAFIGTWGLIALGMRIGKKNAFAFDFGIKIVQILATIILLYLTYALVKTNIHLQITPLIILSLLGLEMICFYTHLTRFVKKRWPWKSYVID